MSRRPRRVPASVPAAASSEDVGVQPVSATPPNSPPGQDAGLTGRYLVLLAEDETDTALKSLAKSSGLRLESVSTGKVEGVDVAEGEGVVFRELGVAVVNAPPDQITAVSAAVAETPTLHVMEPERYVYAIGGIDLTYLRGYRDAVNHLYDLLGGGESAEAAVEPSAALQEDRLTWGLQATRVSGSTFTGSGVRIAVLDTGFDLNHPDFTGRTVRSQSFVTAQEVQDRHGHGTHCIGVACGPRRPQRRPRYGIAYEAEIYAGKVLDNSGRGTDSGILAGIQWALANACPVISMSLGAAVQKDQAYSQIFQQVAERALARGSLVIAAAGNDSNRAQGQRAPVSHPANCPSIMAIAAVDKALRPAWFSNAGINSAGGKIDLAAPGVDVISSWPLPALYKSESGTSMATPHVAGIAALLAQADPAARGRILWAKLLQGAKPLQAPSIDVGAGLAQAP
jgi:subtilisin